MSEFQPTLVSQQEELQKIQKILAELKSKGNLDEISESMSTKEQIELNLNLAYTLSSLYYVYLKVNGMETQQHPILGELQRVQSAYMKFQPKQEQKPNPAKINKEAANRMMKPHIKTLDDEEYQNKQKSLCVEEKDNSKRLSTETYQIEKLHLWDDVEPQKQKLIKGQLMPKTGHLNWKKEIDKIIKK